MALRKVICVGGARPNFVKVAPLTQELSRYPHIHTLLVHTGQHYDDVMSQAFFDELAIPKPDVNLGAGSASHAVQTAMIMERFEPVLLKEEPDLVIVVGDVNSTLACALTSVKLGVRVAHVEAGLRSFDRSMPEEINRVLTDAISDYLFTTDERSRQNLLNEGIAGDKIYFVGNVMIDTLLRHKAKADRSDILWRIGIRERSYGLATLHRSSNVDSRDTLEGILGALREIAQTIPIILPCHPRTRTRIDAFQLQDYINSNANGQAREGINLYDPLGYLDFLKLMAEARVVFTDSGGVQEETTILGVPCLTLRANTERPVTIEQGTNIVVGTSRQRILEAWAKALNGRVPQGRVPQLWDGKAAHRIARILVESFDR